MIRPDGIKEDNEEREEEEEDDDDAKLTFSLNAIATCDKCEPVRNQFNCEIGSIL